jgi:hypothetical protein
VTSDAPRTRRSSDLAARAFALLLDAVGDHWRELVLIGGLVPDTLTGSSEAHQGTLDVDVLLPLALRYDRDDEDFAWLESALTTAGFMPARPEVGWRWLIQVGDDPVMVEFLVDVPDSPGLEIALPGARDLSAKNVAGPGPALRDARVIEFGGREARIAGIGGYLAAKAAAISARDEAKDLYDFAYVLVNSVQPIEEIAAAVATASVPDPRWDRDPRHAVRAVLPHFADADAPGPVTYAAEAVRAGSEETLHDLAADAVAAVAAFARAFEDAVDSD